jgi:hypothetical protein
MLPVTLTGVKLLCGIGDTSQDAGITALIALEQPALEYALDSAVLANAATDAGLGATLTLGVTEVLAGGYLATLGRPQLTVQLFKIATLEISTRPVNDLAKLGAALAAQGVTRLTPFSRSVRSLARTAVGGDQNLDDQTTAPLLLSVSTAADSTFDPVLGADGHTEPPGGDVLASPFFLGFEGGSEP